MEVVTDFLFPSSKITADDDCSHEIRCLLLSRKAMTNLYNVFKSRDITPWTKVSIVNAMVFWVITFSSESWTPNRAECQRIDAFELWCWKRLLKVPWTARRSNQSILREINPEYSLEGLMLKPSLQYFSCLMRTAASLEKSLMLGKIEGWDGWMASPMQWKWTRANCGRRWGTGRPGVRQSMASKRVGHDWATEQQQQLFWQHLTGRY